MHDNTIKQIRNVVLKHYICFLDGHLPDIITNTKVKG
ncbi:hypothetical protein FLSA109164_06225 [Flavobacterium saliperosum]